MPKTWPLCTSAESNLRDRVLGEVGKNSFIVLPGKGGHSRLLPSKTMCPHPGGFGELLIRLGCVQGLPSFKLVSDNLLMSFSGSFNLASSGGLLSYEEC